jgi:hypothetical protein
VDIEEVLDVKGDEQKPEAELVDSFRESSTCNVFGRSLAISTATIDLAFRETISKSLVAPNEQQSVEFYSTSAKHGHAFTFSLERFRDYSLMVFVDGEQLNSRRAPKPSIANATLWSMSRNVNDETIKCERLI